MSKYKPMGGGSSAGGNRNYDGLGMDDGMGNGSYGSYGGYSGYGGGGGRDYGSRYAPNNRHTGTGAAKNIALTLAISLVAPLLMFIIDYRKTSQEEQKIINEYKLARNAQDDPVKRVRDSIAEIKYKQETERALSNYLEINQMMYRLKSQIKTASHITVWKIHNHGGILNTAEQQFITVLYTTDYDSEVEVTDIKEDWGRRELPLGVAWFAVQMKDNGYYEIPEIEKESNYYFGNAKNYSNFIGTKSIAGVYIKTEANSLYFLTASFTGAFPRKLEPYIDVKLHNAKGKLRDLIHPASEVLPTREN